MSADTISTVGPTPNGDESGITMSDGTGGGAGRGGGTGAGNGPLVVVQPPRASAPPRRAPERSQANQDVTLRNGYAAISHSVSGETAAIGLGFLIAGPVGAIIGASIGPVAAATVMWRSRRSEDDENANAKDGPGPLGKDPAGSDKGGAGKANTGASRTPGAGRSGAGKGPDGRGPKGGASGAGKGAGAGSASKTAAPDKPKKAKDPIADKLGKIGKSLADKFKNRDKKDKPPKDGKDQKDSTTPKDAKGSDPKTPKSGSGKGAVGRLRDGLKGLLSDKEAKPDKPKKDKKEKKDKKVKDAKDRASRGTDDTSSSTARDGLEPKKPKGGGGAAADPATDEEEILEGDLLPPDPSSNAKARPEPDIIDAEVVDEDLEKRIQAIRARAERKLRREAIRVGRKAAQQAAREGNVGDPRDAKRAATREALSVVDEEIHTEDRLLAITAQAETPRSSPVNYPAVQASPAGTRTAGVAVAREVDPRGSVSYRLLHALAEQLSKGYLHDDDADMGDHLVELISIPKMCNNLSQAVVAAANALERTAPLHPTVIKHLNAAAQSAKVAGIMANDILVVFVQAHREDIIRVLDPRVGEERWNIRNAQGTLDAAKLKAVLSSAQAARSELPAGASNGSNSQGGKLVGTSVVNTHKLVNLMKGFGRGHMVNVLSEVSGSAAGVDAVAIGMGQLYRRMKDGWATETIVDETVRKTASHVQRVSTELKAAVRQARKMHERELRLNARGRAGKGARVEKQWDVTGRRGSSN